jgi:tetratricopeptide (TPR) repeat protein
MSKTTSKKPGAKPAASRAGSKPLEQARARSAKPAAPSAPAARKNRSAAQGSSARAAAPQPPVLQRRLTPEEVAHKLAMERFEGGLQLFNANQFAKARTVFVKLADNPAPELAERARVYVRICDQRLSRETVQLKSADDFYNYAVGLANQGDAEESEEYLQKALKLAPKADYIYYALATTYALRDDVGGALDYLGKAIALNERNRYQAQNDADFAALLEDPRFTELLYPEKPS